MVAKLLAVSAIALAATTPLAAQITSTGVMRSPPAAQIEAPAATPAIAAPATTNAVLRAGAPVALRLLETITTKEKAARVGQRIRMEVASPVEFNGAVVIPAGTPAEGEVTEVRNKGMWGKSGHLTARALWTRVNGRQIRLTGTFDDKGVTGTGGVVASIALVPLAGFFVTGTSAVLPQGGQVDAFLDEDIELSMRAAPVTPIEVTVPLEAQIQSAPSTQAN